jgi:hypothetical protein
MKKTVIEGLLSFPVSSPRLCGLEIRAKKTGLVDQRVTEKPGEFSNLVLSGITEYIGPDEY